MNRATENVRYGGDNIYDAIMKGDFPLCVLLWGMAKAKRINVLELYEMQNSLLHLAASKGNIDTIGFFMQMAGTSSDILNAVNDSGETPMIQAAHAGNLEAVHMLVINGADLSIRDKFKNDAKHHAASQGHLSVLHYLIFKEKEQEQQYTQRIIKENNKLDEQEKSICEANGEKENDESKEVNCHCKDHCDHAGNTLLHLATLGGHLSIVQYLKEYHDFDLDLRNIQGQTALHIAASYGYKDIVIFLLSCHCNASHLDNQQRTAKDLSRINKHLKIAKLLDQYIKNQEAVNSVAQGISKMRSKTRFDVMIIYSFILLLLLSTCIVLPWYLFVPFLLIVGTVLYHYRPHHHHQLSQKKRRITNFHPSVSLEMQEYTPPSSSVTSLITFLSWLKSKNEWAVGIWFGFFLSYFIYFVYLIFSPQTFLWVKSRYLIEFILFLFCLISMLIAWIRLCLYGTKTDAGKIETFEDDRKHYFIRAQQGIPCESNFCTTCMVIKPIRTKHCRVCNICIARMDHHCVWINNCIGTSNHHTFLVFLTFHIFSLVWTCVIAIEHIIFKSPSSDFCSAIPFIFNDMLPVVVILFWSMLSIVWLSWLLLRQLYHVMINLTENEYLNKSRYEYLKNENGEFVNPFDRGIIRNVKEFMGSSSCFVDYKKTFSVPGTNFVDLRVLSPQENRNLLAST